MRSLLSWFILIVSIALLVSSCSSEEDSKTASTDNTTSSEATTLSAPSGLTANGGANQVTLDWTAVSGASSYTVYWGNATGVSSSSTAITSDSTDNYTHSSLDNGTTNYYKVAAVNSAGTGSLSSEVSATTNLSTFSEFPMDDNLTIGSQTYSHAFKDTCTSTGDTDQSGEVVYYADVIKYLDNKSLLNRFVWFSDSSCTKAYSMGISIVTENMGTLSNPRYTQTIADNITVVQLSNYYDNGTAFPVFDSDNNSVDNGSMYGFIANSDNVSRAGPLKMAGLVYPKSDNEVHATWGSWYACAFTGSDNCTSPDNFTRIQDNVNVGGTATLQLDKTYSVMK